MKLVTTDTLDYVESAKSFDIVASPNGLVYDPETGAMAQDTIQVEVWYNDPDSDPGRIHVISLSTYDLTLSASAGGVNVDTGGETKTEVVTREESDDTLLFFWDLLSEFNSVLAANGKQPVNSTMGVFDYLVEAYYGVINEYEDANSPLFSTDTYQDVPEVVSGVSGFRGSSMAYENTAVNAMTAWVLAMCLAEIVPTSGSQTNVQTQLFAKAYELGGGRDVPLYGGYALRADPMIGRLVAGAVYARLRGQKSADTINVFRSELGGSSISASDWNGLGYTHTETLYNGVRSGYTMNSLGYLVNADLFLPSAPGPRIANSKAAGKPQPSTQGQSASLFNSDGNYKVDANVNTLLIDNFQMSKILARNTWNGYSTSRKNWLIHTAALARCTTRYMFSGKINVSLQSGGDGSQFTFVKSDTDTGLAIEGPFSILAGKNLYPFLPQTTDADIEAAKDNVQRFMETILEIADNSRYPLYDPNFGRRRPCSPTSGLAGGAYSSTIGHKQNAIYNISLTLMVADNQKQYNKWNAEDQDNHATERPNSYPSGHSAQIWTMAMILGQMDPSNLATYMRGAYRYSVGRTVGRAHWNSDVIYGRLFGTMILPIINAMTGLQTGYGTMKAKVLGEDQNYGYTVMMSVTIYNGSSNAVTLGGDVKFYVPNPDPAGREYGWSGKYNGYEVQFWPTTFVLAAGASKTFNGLSIDGIGGRSPISLSALQAASSSKTANVELSDANGNKGVIVPQNLSTDFVFTNGCNCQVNIGSGSPASLDVTTYVTIVNNSGREITFDGIITFILYGLHPTENRYYYYRPKGYCSGNGFTIPNGQSKRYTVVFIPDIDETGMPFASQAQIQGLGGAYQCNNAYYINGSGYTCVDISTSVTLQQNGEYTMTIPSNTHEWTS